MYLGQYKEEKTYIRSSKLGADHEYTRSVTMIQFRCDSCGNKFSRPKGNISPKRLNNNYFHCCPDCDSKRFAQKKGAERRTMWDMDASSLADISRL